jgi:hypothetical protein
VVRHITGAPPATEQLTDCVELYVPVPGVQEGVFAVGGFVPVPLSADVTGLAPSPPLYDTLSVVDREPVAPGVNTTEKVQELDAVSVPLAAEHDPAPEFVIAKSPVFPPVAEGVTLVAVVLLPFVTVKVTGELATLTTTEPKFSEEGDRETLPPVKKLCALNPAIGLSVPFVPPKLSYITCAGVLLANPPMPVPPVTSGPFKGKGCEPNQAGFDVR